VGSSFEYHYDFGDNWSHDILLESISLAIPRKRYPTCVAGALSAPPEDVGGIGGYQRYLEAPSVAVTDRILGCPHEEGVDYEGRVCPQCPFWAHRNRWTGEIEQ
jgi:hypothetical protein